MKNLLKSPKRLLKPALLGAAMPLAYLLYIIISKEDQFETWMSIPLVMIPLGGAIGGIVFFTLQKLPVTKPIQIVALALVGILLYGLCLWISSILAFNLTGDWD